MPLMGGPGMATGRALITESEREYLAGDHGDQRMYEAKSRIRRRIQERLAEDMKYLDEEAPELNEVLCEVVCKEDR